MLLIISIVAFAFLTLLNRGIAVLVAICMVISHAYPASFMVFIGFGFLATFLKWYLQLNAQRYTS